jgi:hypothetical protein
VRLPRRYLSVNSAVEAIHASVAQRASRYSARGRDDRQAYCQEGTGSQQPASMVARVITDT